MEMGTFTDVTVDAGIISGSEEVQLERGETMIMTVTPISMLPLGWTVEGWQTSATPCKIWRQYRLSRELPVSCTTTMEMALLLT